MFRQKLYNFGIIRDKFVIKLYYTPKSMSTLSTFGTWKNIFIIGQKSFRIKN